MAKKAVKPKKADPLILPFKAPTNFRAWLTKNHNTQDELWIRHFKKDSGTKSVTYAEALDEALCFGWIDAQSKSYDELSWLQRYCPRRPKSKWSKINRGHVERLIKAKKMRAPGLAAIESAKLDGRWDAAYDSPANSVLSDDFLLALNRSPKAKEFFETLNRTNRYAITYRIQTAKRPETRLRWITRILEMLELGKKFHS